MALSWRKKLILAKIETTYGTDAVPTGATNAILSVDGKIEPMLGNDESRELDQPWMGAQPTIPTELHAKVSFGVELEPSGTAGTAPGWGPLLRGCGLAQTIVPATSVAYSPVTDGHEAVTLYFSLDGRRYALVGARGTVALDLTTQKIPRLLFEFQGLWTLPTDAAIPTPDYTVFKKPLVASKTNTPIFTVGGISLLLKTMKFDLANQLENRFLVGQAAGAESVIIIDRAPMAEMLVEAETLATFNPYVMARDQTTVAVQLRHGVAVGRRATLTIPALQLQRPDSPSEDQKRVMDPLKGVALPVAGNDEFTLVLA